MRQAPTHRSTLFTLSTISLAVLALPALAQQAAPAPAAAASAAELERVTITTGTRTAKAVDKIAGAVNVVGKEELKNTLALTEDATAVLTRSVPGYAESTQAMSNTGENLRGRIALRLFDGVPQGSPLREGTRNGTFTDMNVIGRIEVINGPSASEGIGGAGGIINYISKRPTKPGNEWELTNRYSTQFKDDSADWKTGLTFAHLGDRWDLFAAASYVDRGIAWDGAGNRVGMNSSGSLMDTRTQNFFIKGGYNFGTDNEQRVTASFSNFNIKGKGNYIRADGDRSKGIVTTSILGMPVAGKTEFNDFQQGQITYDHGNLLGGALSLNLYYADQGMRYVAEVDPAKRDPILAPGGIEQSEIHSKKIGLRTAWTRTDLAGVQGLELRAGLDLVRDEAEQRLALTNRVWTPPMIYKSVAPFAQLSYDIGPVTLSGGLRRENGKLHVDDYTTVFVRNYSMVEGGTLSYAATLPNVGLVWRLPAGWSAYASYGKGFTLPNIGVPLRNISIPGQSLNSILNLEAVIVKNTEIGVNWRGKMGSFGASYYDSRSQLGSSIRSATLTDPNGVKYIDFVLDRNPVYIKGIEISGELNLDKQWRASASYSRIRGKTSITPGGPIDVNMGVIDINPDKIVLSTTWKPMPAAELTLGTTQILSRSQDNVKVPTNANVPGPEHTSGYGLWDLSGSYDTGRYGKITVGIENVFNKYYIPAWSQIDPNFGPGFSNYWSARGRVVSITHTLTF